jgi:LPS-assembly lipoprotein
MWWSRAVPILLLGGTVAASACGFRPLYGDPAVGAAPSPTEALAAVDVLPINDRTGQQLRNRLVDVLNPERLLVPSRYVLRVELDEESTALALARSGLATRSNIQILASYALLDASTGVPVVTGASRAVSGLNTGGSQFATQIAIEDARNRNVRRLADDIRRRLGAHFAGAGPLAETPDAEGQASE